MQLFPKIHKGHWFRQGLMVACLAVPRLCLGAAADQPVKQAALTAMAAAVSAGSYTSGSSLETRYLEDYGWKLTPYTVKDGDTEVHFTLARSDRPLHGKNWTVLALRGSASKADWKLNLKTGKVSFPAGKPLAKKTEDREPAVHEGFLKYARAVLSQPLDVDGDGQPDELATFYKTHPNEKLLLTGHSLGGAGATLLDSELVQQGVAPEQVPVITFGAPAVGNAAFARQVGDRLRLQRVVTSLDPVPGALQTFYKGYEQFGQEKKFTLSGKYTDYQHPISYYLDLAVKDYYTQREQAEKDGAWQPVPLEKRDGKGPLVALVLISEDHGADTRFSPDLGQFLLDEYRSLLPRYVVLEYRHQADGTVPWPKEELKEKARKAGADLLVVTRLERQRVGQTDKWSIQLAQDIVGLHPGGIRVVGAGSTRVRFQQGILQSTLSLWEEQKKILQKVLPEESRQEPLWIFLREEGNANEDH
jgi:hypothetical protein